jgi:hypothetical protein
MEQVLMACLSKYEGRNTAILRQARDEVLRWAGALLLALATWAAVVPAHAEPAYFELWQSDFPKTDFGRATVSLDEIRDDGNFRDTIRPINSPKFQPVSELTAMGPLEPVLSLIIDGDARAYPLRILLWHEIVNDVVAGIPVLVSYCPLCNSGVVYDRRVGDAVLEFGNTGRIRHFDMVMYDRQSESWWQQFTGEAIVGEMSGTTLRIVPARLESLDKFRQRAPNGKLLIPDSVMTHPYGETPYMGMDSLWVTQSRTMLRERYPYDLPEDVSPLTRVVVIGDTAWGLELLRARGRVESDDLIIEWEAGQNSLHDHPVILAGRDVGNVVVRRRAADGAFEDVPYDVTFAFAFRAFRPDGDLHLNP